MGLIDAVARDAAQYLGLSLKVNTPLEIIEKVNAIITNLVLDQPIDIPEGEEPDLLLGCLWGAQMQREFNWYWADVVIDNDVKEIAIVSPQQEMIIFPLSFVGACIQKQCICTVLLAFNMLMKKEGFDELKPSEYENIMLNIHHIVPPYSLQQIG